MREACLYFAGIDWGHTWQRPQQLALRLAARLDVLYVEPLGLRRARLGDLARLRRGLAQPEACRPGVTRCGRPLYLPWPGVGWVERLNGRLLAAGLRRKLGGRRPRFAWLGVPSRAALLALQGWPGLPVVYDALDDFAAFHGNSAFVRDSEALCLDAACLALATSGAIAERLRHRHAHVEPLPNAADVTLFEAPADGPGPPELAALPRPVAGYCGELGHWFDTDVVARLAHGRPDVSFALVGPATVLVRRALRRLPNVHLLGPRPYAAVPGYVTRFDVALLPFRLGPLTAAVNPIKLYEYLAVGAPIVATPLAELEPFAARGLVRLAPADGFAAALDGALLEHSPELRAARRCAARNHTWDVRAQRLWRLLDAQGLAPRLARP